VGEGVGLAVVAVGEPDAGVLAVGDASGSG
jgi:hypothetical protein